MLFALYTGLYAWEIVRNHHLSGLFFMLLYTTVCQSLTENSSLSIKHHSSCARSPLSVNSSQIGASGLTSSPMKRLRSHQEQHQATGMPCETPCHFFNVVSKYGLSTGTEAANGASFSSSYKIDARPTRTGSSADDFAGLQSAIENYNGRTLSDRRHQNIFTSQRTKQRPNHGSQILNLEESLTYGEKGEAVSSTKHQKPNIVTGTIKTHGVSRRYGALQSSTSAVLKQEKDFSSPVSAKKRQTLNTFGSSTRTTTRYIPVSIVTPYKKFRGSVSSLHARDALLESNALSSRDGRSKSTFLSRYSAGVTTEAQKRSSSSSKVHYLPRVSPSYTGYVVELFAKSTKTRLAVSAKADTRTPLAGLSHEALSSSVSNSVTESGKTTLVCMVNGRSCACFNCDEARRTEEKIACCVDLVDQEMIRHAALLCLVNITVQEVSERVSTASRIIAEVVREWCTTSIMVCIKAGFAAQRRRRSLPYQSLAFNATFSSGNANSSSDDENNYQQLPTIINNYQQLPRLSETVKTQPLSQKSLKHSTSIKKKALRHEIIPASVSNVNAIIYRISSEAAEPQTVQTAFYVTVTTLNNGTNQTQVLDGKVLLQILRARRQTLQNRLNITVASISARQASLKKQTTTSLGILPDPTPGSYKRQTSLATFTGRHVL